MLLYMTLIIAIKEQIRRLVHKLFEKIFYLEFGWLTTQNPFSKFEDSVYTTSCQIGYCSHLSALNTFKKQNVGNSISWLIQQILSNQPGEFDLSERQGYDNLQILNKRVI